MSAERKQMSQISLRYEGTAAFLSVAQLTILASALLHLRAFAQEHFRYELDAVIQPFFDRWPLNRVKQS